MKIEEQICYFKSTGSESCVDENYNNSVNLIILLIETENNIM